jgi:hypothetical protein
MLALPLKAPDVRCRVHTGTARYLRAPGTHFKGLAAPALAALVAWKVGRVRPSPKDQAPARLEGNDPAGGTPGAPIARIGVAVFAVHAKPAILSVVGIKPAQSVPSLHSQDCA